MRRRIGWYVSFVVRSPISSDRSRSWRPSSGLGCFWTSLGRSREPALDSAIWSWCANDLLRLLPPRRTSSARPSGVQPWGQERLLYRGSWTKTLNLLRVVSRAIRRSCYRSSRPDSPRASCDPLSRGSTLWTERHKPLRQMSRPTFRNLSAKGSAM